MWTRRLTLAFGLLGWVAAATACFALVAAAVEPDPCAGLFVHPMTGERPVAP